MILIDSSGWLEYFTEGPLASSYATYLKDPHQIVTPTLVLYEVYKIIKKQATEEEALAAITVMGKSRLIELTDTLALTAADMSLKYGLAMADAIIYATALAENAKLITSDYDLASLPGVTFLKKAK